MSGKIKEKSLLQKRLEWEAANPKPESLRRVERAIVKGLVKEFGIGQQFQVTHMDGFEIAIDDVLIYVRMNSNL